MNVIIVCFCLLCSCVKTERSEAIKQNIEAEISSRQRIEKKEMVKYLFDFIEMQTTE